MKIVSLLLALLALFALPQARAQDGWFKIHSDQVYWYQAVTGDSLFALTATGLQRTDDGGVSWSHVSDWPKASSFETEYDQTTSGISYIKFGSITHGMRTRMTKVVNKHWGEWSESTVDEFTTNGGKTWYVGKERGASGLPDVALFFEPKTWFIMRRQGIYDPIIPANEPQSELSTDAGRTWSERTLPQPMIEQGLAVRPDLIFVDNFVTRDTGATWTKLERTLYRVQALTPSLLYSQWMDSSLFSSDEGITWSAKYDTIQFDLSNQRGIVYGSTGSTYNKSAKYWRSLDSGSNFHELPYFLPKSDITLFDTSLLYALQDGELLKSRTGGQKLEVRSTHIPLKIELFPNPANDIVTATRDLDWYDLLGHSYSPPSEKIGEGYRYDVRGLNAGAYIVRYGEKSHIVIVQR